MSDTKLLQAYNKVATTESAKSLTGYLDWVVADSRPPQRFKNIIQPWQKELNAHLVPLFECAAGFQDTPKKALFQVMPKGHDKTSGAARCVNWLLCFAKRHVSITIAASDSNQSAIFLSRMREEARHNTFLNLRFCQNKVHGPMGIATIVSSEAGSVQGKIDDLTIIDELSWHAKPDLAQNLISGRVKRPDACIIILTNAGIKNSYAWQVYKQALADKENWIVAEVPPFSATWLNRSVIEADEKLLLKQLYSRVWLNRWIDITEDCGYVSKEQMKACVNPELTPRSSNDAYPVAVGIDIGLVNDASVLSVVGYHEGCFILQDYKVWRGTNDNPVKIQAIEDELLRVMKSYDVRMVYCDPYELRALIQKFEAKMPIEPYYQTTASLHKLAENFRALVREKSFQIYPQATELIEEVSKLFVEERNGGLSYRVQHVPGEHNDIFCATSLALMALVDLKPQLELRMSVITPPAPPPKVDSFWGQQEQKTNDYSKWIIQG